MDSQRRGGRLEYLVDWRIWARGRSWVVRDNILDPMLLEDFHRTHPIVLYTGRGRPRRHLRRGNVRDLTLSQPPSSPQSLNTTYTQSHSPVFNHLQLHLPIPIKSPSKARCFQSITVRSTVHYPRTVPDFLVLQTCLYLPFSFLLILQCYSPVLRLSSPAIAFHDNASPIVQ